MEECEQRVPRDFLLAEKESLKVSRDIRVRCDRHPPEEDTPVCACVCVCAEMQNSVTSAIAYLCQLQLRRPQATLLRPPPPAEGSLALIGRQTALYFLGNCKIYKYARHREKRQQQLSSSTSNCAKIPRPPRSQCAIP